MLQMVLSPSFVLPHPTLKWHLCVPAFRGSPIYFIHPFIIDMEDLGNKREEFLVMFFTIISSFVLTIKNIASWL